MNSGDKYVMLSLEGLAKKYESLAMAADPAQWIRQVLGEWTWSKQDEILRSLIDHRYTAVQACHGVGKSFIASRAVAWWIATKPIGRTYVITTAPTQAQVEAVLWKEIKRAHSISQIPPGSYITAGNPLLWKTSDGRQIAMGRKPSEHDVGAFQGIHDDFLLIVIDEACGIPKVLYDAIDSMATGAENRVLAIGNPDDPSTHFRVVCKDMPDWHTIRIDGLQSPNINEAACQEYPVLRDILRDAGLEPTTETVPDNVAQSLMSARWVAERARMWGTKSSLWQAKVRGEFPDNSTEGVIPLGWVEAAMKRFMDWDEEGRPELPGRTIVSVDVARSGEDATCIAVRRGRAILKLEQVHNLDTREVTDKTKLALGPGTLEIPYIGFVVDVIGVGAGVFDNLKHDFLNLGWQFPPLVNAFNASESPPSTDTQGEFAFINRRAWAWWHMREILDPTRPGGSTVMLPPDELLKADLTTPKWSVAQSGNPPKIKIESKDDIRARLGRSPDAGDAVVMAFAAEASNRPNPVDPGAVHEWGERRQQSSPHVIHKWDTSGWDL